MKTEKMSFKNFKDVLSRDEMKSIMAGSGGRACGGYLTGYGYVTGLCAGSSISACERACTNAGYLYCVCI